jgi:hypothetical protein
MEEKVTPERIPFDKAKAERARACAETVAEVVAYIDLCQPADLATLRSRLAGSRRAWRAELGAATLRRKNEARLPYTTEDAEMARELSRALTPPTILIAVCRSCGEPVGDGFAHADC